MKTTKAGRSGALVDPDPRSESITIIALDGLPDVKPGDDIGELIVKRALEKEVGILDGDVVVVAHKIVSKAEGRVVNLSSVRPSSFAETLAHRLNRRPEEVEVVLGESKNIVRCKRGVLITETRHGFIMANSGVDHSNVEGADDVVLLPEDPDASAKRIRDRIRELTGARVAVIISDTTGRPFRHGQVNMALGVAGMPLFRDYRGLTDQYGKELKVTCIAHVDELASAAELVMGKKRRVPVVIIRGYAFESVDEPITNIVRSEDEDIFR